MWGSLRSYDDPKDQTGMIPVKPVVVAGALLRFEVPTIVEATCSMGRRMPSGHVLQAASAVDMALCILATKMGRIPKVLATALSQVFG